MSLSVAFTGEAPALIFPQLKIIESRTWLTVWSKG